MSSQLLMIEDDARLAQMVGEYLGQSGLQSPTVPTARVAWRNCKGPSPARCPTWSSWT